MSELIGYILILGLLPILVVLYSVAFSIVREVLKK